MSTHPIKPITIPGEGKQRQKYISEERYLEERYQISLGLKGTKRLGVESLKRQKGEKHKDFINRRMNEGDETFEDFQIRRKAENGLLKEYRRGVWMTDGNCTALKSPCRNCE
jgi:hypothetical protein